MGAPPLLESWRGDVTHVLSKSHNRLEMTRLLRINTADSEKQSHGGFASSVEGAVARGAYSPMPQCRAV